ncbi:MAG: 6-phosphogluconolactonase [Pirellulaceae bacterium]|nr:6-phosphogluconolactonase [Pirellulaceae bacterium]
MSTRLWVSDDFESLVGQAAQWLIQAMVDHQADSNRPFSLALAGGSTPKRLYQVLSQTAQQQGVDWYKVLLVLGDERNVPADHQDSNYRMIRENLLGGIQIPDDNILTIPDPGGDATVAAEKYERILRDRLTKRPDGWPMLDCVLLGLGDDVHTASLFPDSSALTQSRRCYVANWVAKLDCWRMTATFPLVNSAERVAFLVSGASKSSALQALWHSPHDLHRFPAQGIAPQRAELNFFVDRAALGSVVPPQGLVVETD